MNKMRIFQLILIQQLTIATVALTSNNNNVQRNVNNPQQVIQMDRRNVLFGLASVVPFVLNVPTTYAVEEREVPDSFDVDSYLRTGYVANPMGVSGQAGKSRPETGV